MAGYGVRSELTVDYQAIIELRRTTPFETTAWSIDYFDSDYPNGELPYGLHQSGDGVLSNAGKTLTITIEICPPDDFRLTVGSFSKIFNLSEDRIKLGNTIVAANDVTWTKLWGGQYQADRFGGGVTGPALVFFTGKKVPTEKGGNHSAKMYQDGVLKGIAFGTTFNSVSAMTPQDFHMMWPYSGILFYRFGWLGTPPVDPQEYIIVVESGARAAGDSKQEFEVTMSSTQAIGPTSGSYTVTNEDSFNLDDGYL